MKIYTLNDFLINFPDDNACLEWILNHFYPEGVYCPTCQMITRHHRMKTRHSYSCDRCGHHIHPTAGTIFEKSTTPLKSWFYAMFLMSATRCGISAKQLQREVGVTYKTAWRMFRQIRELFDDNQMLSGEVEVDETYIGARHAGKRGRGAEGKTALIGIVQRQGKVTTDIVTNTKRSTVMPLITKNVAKRTIVYTDEYPIYNTVSDNGFTHRRCNHGTGEYVIGDVHTNTIEGFWSLLKRGINGVYHAVSPKYLQSYVNEYAFRYNHRADEKSMFKTVLEQI